MRKLSRANNIFLEWITLPLIFLILGVAFALISLIKLDISPTVLSYHHSTSTLKNENGIIYGTIKAYENYLGIITVNFDTRIKYSGKINFKIKKSGYDRWLHSSEINASQINTIPTYNFGVPVIEKSKGNIYEFIIKLANGSSSSRLLLANDQILVTQYSFPKKILMSDKKVLFNFIFKKIFYSFQKKEAINIFLVSLIPLILYLAFKISSLFFNYSKLQNSIKNKFIFTLKPYVFLILILIAFDIFILPYYSDIVTLTLLLLWLIIVYFSKFKAKNAFLVSILLLLISPFLLYANIDISAEKSSIWAYIFILIGTFQLLFELQR